MVNYNLKLDYFDNFTLIAINSQAKDYRICYLLNHHLDYALVKADDIELPQNKKNTISYHSCFTFTTEYHEFVLLSNRQDDSFLLPELKNIPFLFIVKGNSNPSFTDEILEKIKQIPEIIYATAVPDIEKLKNVKNIIV